MLSSILQLSQVTYLVCLSQHPLLIRRVLTKQDSEDGVWIVAEDAFGTHCGGDVSFGAVLWETKALSLLNDG